MESSKENLFRSEIRNVCFYIVKSAMESNNINSPEDLYKLPVDEYAISYYTELATDFEPDPFIEKWLNDNG